MTYLELDGQIVRLEEMDHPSDPSLLFRQLPIIYRLSSARSTGRCRVLLISYQHGTKTKDTRDIFGIIDQGIVLQDRRYDSLTNGEPCRVWLSRKQGCIGWDSEKGKNRGV